MCRTAAAGLLIEIKHSDIQLQPTGRKKAAWGALSEPLSSRAVLFQTPPRIVLVPNSPRFQ